VESLPLLIRLKNVDNPIDIISEDLDFSAEETGLAKKLINQGLPPLAKPAVLPYLFGISHQLVGYIEQFPERFYRTFTLPKRTGGERIIVAPRVVLKTIQRWIHTNICLKAIPHSSATAFIKGKNIFANARVHSQSKNLMVIDITDFFPSIRFNQVENIFKGFGFPDKVNHQLTALCCLDGSLPQGAPTSPILSNLVFKPADIRLSDLAAEWHCNYTRYADDLAFSGSRVFTKDDKSQVGDILKEFGLCINERKSRIIGQGGRQMIAGVVVNQYALPLRIRRKRWRATFHRASRHPKEFKGRLSSLAGTIAFIKQFSPETAAKYQQTLKAVSKY
jgi:RNA-directed DNA polymerase